MTDRRASAEPMTEPSEMREFLLVLRQALLMVTCWIEKRYGIERK